MDKKIFVGALVDIETVDEKLDKFLRAREEFHRAAYELEKAVNTCTFKFEIKGCPTKTRRTQGQEWTIEYIGFRNTAQIDGASAETSERRHRIATISQTD